MTDGAAFIPALTLQRQLEALAFLGLDVDAVRARVGELPCEPDALVPAQQYNDMWGAAQAQYGLPGLPTALAMAVPFGAFGAIDYLAGSAETVGAACESVLSHLSMVAIDVGLQHETMTDGSHLLEVRGVGAMPGVALEFTLALIVGRLRYLVGDGFQLVAVALPVEAPTHDSVRSRLWNAQLTYDHSCASFTMAATVWAMPIHRADAYLHATLQRVAAQLQLARPNLPELEQALRARLRDALGQGCADSQRMASLLGISQRTLQRRLQDLGRSFSTVVEDFKRDEALRLLQDDREHLVHIAARLGYAEQTSFTRAFRRWTGETPGAWRTARRRGPQHGNQ